MKHTYDIEQEIKRISYWTNWDEYTNPTEEMRILYTYEKYLKYFLEKDLNYRRELLKGWDKWLRDTEEPPNSDELEDEYVEYVAIAKAAAFLEEPSTAIKDLKKKNKELKKKIKELQAEIDKNKFLINQVMEA